MDEKVGEIKLEHSIPRGVLYSSQRVNPYIVGKVHGIANEALPITLKIEDVGVAQIKGSGYLFSIGDEEYGCINEFFHQVMRARRIRSIFPIHVPLNLPNTKEAVLIRQEAVKELAQNTEAFNALERILQSNIFSDNHMYRRTYRTLSDHSDVQIEYTGNPEKVTSFLDEVIGLEKLGLESLALKNIIYWAQDLSSDTVFQEIVRKKRKITDARIISVFSERYDAVRYGILKPGMKPEDVFDFIIPELEGLQDLNGKKVISKKIVKYKNPNDEAEIVDAVGRARQDMNILNRLTSTLLAAPLLVMQYQIKHLYQGALLHNYLKNEGFPVTFASLEENIQTLQVDDIYPIRLVFDGIKINNLASNSFNFREHERLVQIEGPNNRGKSEAWRTLNLMNLLINAGYPVPARNANLSLVDASHFISCKGESGNGGSELERSLRGIYSALEKVHEGDTVILDELGDATNAPTALKIAERLLPVLIAKNCRVLITTHHNALTRYIADSFKGVSLTPHPSGEGPDKYKLVPAKEDIDFKPEETLDQLGFKTDALSKRINAGRREVMPVNTFSDFKIKELREEEDMPF